jgi:UDP-GlcNAc:undecaprenyl-phosphate GlcNAc-1-phosphate transferase
MRRLALKLNLLDVPLSDVKTHKTPTPYLGGIAVFIAFTLTLVALRFTTHFPTGTLRALRGILAGGGIMLLLGLLDDVLPKTFGYRSKFIVQAIAGVILIFYGVKIKFIHPEWFGIFITLLWCLAIINSFNIIDIMDGLCAGICFIASLALFFIGLIGEEIYVNFASIVLAGACLGFLPFNLSKKYKIFLGDAGSLSIGFIVAACSMGTSYTKFNQIGLLAPLLILGVPLFDTIFVSYQRIKKGRSPFLGSKDHFALRLGKIGLSKSKVLLLSYLACFILSFLAFLVTRVKLEMAILVLIITILISYYIALKIGKIEIE